MKLSKLLATRQALLRQTQLANLAFAYTILQRFASRITIARLQGRVTLCPADPRDEAYWASLTALDGNQSVIEEHFADHELIELADALALATGNEFSELTFRLEELGDRFLPPLREALAGAGIELDSPHHQLPDLATDSSD